MSNDQGGLCHPLLTVLIPTRNRWPLLAAQAHAVSEVLAEFDCAFEVIVHDNSTQPPPDGLIEALPSRVRYVRSPELFDTAEENICEAFGHCRGEYVWLLADDDGVDLGGVAALLDILRRGEDDIIVFNSRHGRDERLAGEGGYVTERARRIFHEREMRCSIATFVQRTGFFYWICAISTVVVRRRAAPVGPLRKYLGIARIYAHVAWLIEIGKDRPFLFVNRPLVTYGLLPTDHDGGRHWRSVGVREGGYANAVWTGLWLRVLDELLAQGALTLDQVRRTTEMNHATRFHFGSNLAYQVLEQLGEMPEQTPSEDLAIMTRWLRRLFPGAIFLNALIDEIAGFTQRHGASLLRVESDSRLDQGQRAIAGDLRSRAAWWRRAVGETPWYAPYYVETLHLYDIYDFGDDWVAAHVAFGSLREALEVIDLPSLPPGFLRAPDHPALLALIEAQHLDLEGLKALRTASLPIPGEWGRLKPESAATQVHVASPPVVVEAREADGEVPLLRAELLRQDAQLAEMYASPSWRWAERLRRLTGQGGSRAARAGSTLAPLLELGVRLDLNREIADGHLVRGFSYLEEWGRWTDGPVAVFRCRHPLRDAPGLLEVWPHLVWDNAGTRTCTVDVRVNGGQARRFTVTPGEPLRAPLPARVMAEPEFEAVFHVRTPKTPQEEPVDDPRALGLGIAAVRLSVVASERGAAAP